MNRDAQFEALIAEAMAAPVSGWRFTFLEERMRVERPSWNYESLARGLLQRSRRAIDHGTGGGEVLADLGVVPSLLVATEAYAPKASLAAARLSSLGASVVRVEPDTFDSRGPIDPLTTKRRLPFRAAWADAFLARHSAFSPNEAFRVLQPGGELLYQGGLVSGRRPGHVQLRDHMGSDYDPGWGEWEIRGTVLDAGFELLDYREQLLATHYLDIAAVVFELRKAPWAVGQFVLDDHRERLRELHDRICRDGYLRTTWTSVLVHARKTT
ncbi:MAG: hypothetical protein WD296_07625 [Acidimicrobiia bacterium]